MIALDDNILNAKYRALLPEAEKVKVDKNALQACFTLLSVADELFNVCHERLAGHQLSEGRFTVLLLLRQGAASTPSTLASQANVTRATMTGLTDGLVRDGFVARSGTAGDRRSLNISLTAKGERVLEKVIPKQLQWLESMFSEMTPERRQDFVVCLEQIRRRARDEKK